MTSSKSPRWLGEMFKPKGSRDDAFRVLRSVIGDRSGKKNPNSQREIDRFERGTYKPQVTTYKSEEDAVLPSISGGTCLSLPGALDAIECAVRAFNFEDAVQQKASSPGQVNAELSAVAVQARSLAKSLISISEDARWRLSCLVSEDLWPTSWEGRGIRFPNAFRMEPDQAVSFYEHITEDDVRFLQLRVGELLPCLSEGSPEDSQWNQNLLGLAEVLQKGADSVPGPREKRDERRRPNFEQGAGGFAAFLLIRECDSILYAAENKPLKRKPSGRKSHTFHKGLKAFAEAMYEYATGVEPLSVLDRPFREYSDSMTSHIESHPYAWRLFRIADLHLRDFEKHGDRNAKDGYFLKVLA